MLMVVCIVVYLMNEHVLNHEFRAMVARHARVNVKRDHQTILGLTGISVSRREATESRYEARYKWLLYERAQQALADETRGSV